MFSTRSAKLYMNSGITALVTFIHCVLIPGVLPPCLAWRDTVDTMHEISYIVKIKDSINNH